LSYLSFLVTFFEFPATLGEALALQLIQRLSDHTPQTPKNYRAATQQTVNQNALDNSCQPTQNQSRKNPVGQTVLIRLSDCQTSAPPAPIKEKTKCHKK
jgi:hypothetical protein